MPISELLCTDLLSVDRAAAAGADRIELCAALEVGGVTPGPGLQRLAIERARAAAAPMGVVVLVRPRRGDFVLDGPGDLDVLRTEIRSAREAGAEGVAVGVLNRADQVDVASMRALLNEAQDMPVTFHRAIDHTPDLLASVETLLELGIRRVLTSGQAPTAWQGRGALAELVRRFGGDIEIIAGGGVSGANASSVLDATGVHGLHGSCTREVVAPPSERPRTNLGKPGAPSESSRLTLDESSARALVAATKAGGQGAAPTKTPTAAEREARGDLDVHVHPSVDAACEAIAAEMIEIAQANPKAVLGLATGSTMLGVYAAFVRRAKERSLDCTGLTTFNLDEYVGVRPTDPNSFRAFMVSHLFQPAGFDPARCHFPSVSSGDPNEAAEEYEDSIRAAGGLELQLLGIGRNGHIAFNEPGSAKDSRTRPIELDEVTRRDAADAFGGLECVPTHAMTMGVATILDARRVRVLAFGEHKAQIVARSLSEAPSSEVPCTWVRGHPDASLHVDPAAARDLSGRS